MIGQLVQRRGRPLRHRLDKLPQAIHRFAAPRLQLAGVFRQVRTKLFTANVGTASKQTARITPSLYTEHSTGCASVVSAGPKPRAR